MKKMKWFENWFDSKYYQILYKNRNQEEAKLLIDNLINKFKPNKYSCFLDLCCGNGRHATYLNKQGFKVDGVDLSDKSLNIARKNKNQNLNFYCEDMREYVKNNKYDFILNLFTSFGYFETKQDNLRVIKNSCKSLKINGYFIIDFFNSEIIKKNIIEKEIKIINDIIFKINKSYDKEFIYKQIEINDKGSKYTFTEKVRLLNKSSFIDLSKGLNLRLEETFGDYYLNPFNELNSDRLIIVFKKINNYE